MLTKKVEQILSKLDDENDKETIRNLLEVTEQSRAYVEVGYGTYSLMRSIVKAYDPEIINLYNWTNRRRMFKSYKNKDIEFVYCDLSPLDDAYLVIDIKSKKSMIVEKSKVEAIARRRDFKLLSTGS